MKNVKLINVCPVLISEDIILIGIGLISNNRIYFENSDYIEN